MKKLTRLVLSAILTSASAVLSIATALAQQSQQAQVSATSGALEEVVVTAQFREEPLQQTPIAITAITAEDLQVRQIVSAYEIGYTVPNASLRQTGAAFGNTMSAFIRGIGQYDFLAEFEPGVGIYFDDVLHPFTMGSMIDLMDLERVEVLRGPQGTLFGRGSIGGAIRYVSKKPQGDNTGSIQVVAGDYDRIDVRAAYDFALSDTTFARITGVSKNRDGYQDVFDFACLNAVPPGSPPGPAGSLPNAIPNRGKGCKVGTQGGQTVNGARGALRWVPNDKFELLLTGDYQNDSSEVRADHLVNVTPSPPGSPFQVWNEHYLQPTYGVQFDSRFVPSDRFTSYATYLDPKSGLDFTPQTALTQQGGSLELDWNMTENSLAELILSYREFDSNFATDADQSPINEQLVDGHQDVDSQTAELRFSGRAFDRMDWTTGLFWYQGDFTTSQTVSIPAFIFAGVYGGAIAMGAPVPVAESIAAGVINGPARFLVNGLNNTKSENRSVYLHTVTDFTDKFSFVAGVRYSEDDKDEEFDNTIVVTALNTSDDHFDWRAGFDYRFTDSMMGYVSAATGYRPQAFNPRPFQYTQFVQVDAEEALSYEVGFKGDFMDHRLRTNLAVFYVDYSQRILPVGGTECLVNPTPPPTYIPDNPANPASITDSLGNVCDAVTSRTFYQNTPGISQGAEIELTWQPTDALNFTALYGYTDWSSDDLDAANVVVDYPIYVPEYNWAVGMSYDFNIGNGSTLTPRVDVYGQAEICTSTLSTAGCAPAYDLTNVRLEWASPDRTWLVGVGVTNVFDEEYYLNIFDLSQFGQPTTEGQPGMPQEWYVSFTRNFQ